MKYIILSRRNRSLAIDYTDKIVRCIFEPFFSFFLSAKFVINFCWRLFCSFGVSFLFQFHCWNWNTFRANVRTRKCRGIFSSVKYRWRQTHNATRYSNKHWAFCMQRTRFECGNPRRFGRRPRLYFTQRSNTRHIKCILLYCAPFKCVCTALRLVYMCTSPSISFSRWQKCEFAIR